MKRRNFIGALAGLAALPVIGEVVQTQSEVSPKVEPNGTWTLTHKESRSGLRCTDVRVNIDSSEGERIFIEMIKRNPGHMQKILNG